jgi:hypothetical protein
MATLTYLKDPPAKPAQDEPRQATVFGVARKDALSPLRLAPPCRPAMPSAYG